jgi:protein-tyrosine phosphatase
MAEIDFHAHILPGCDHGSKGLETSLRQVALAKAAGVDVICATSHFYGNQSTAEHFLEKRARCWLELKAQLKEDDPRILLGAEVLAFEGIEQMPRIRELCLAGTDLLLLEMPFVHWSERLIDSVEALSERRDIRIVLAHVDRYDRDQIEMLFSFDRVKGQVNVSSLKKRFQSGYLREWMRKGSIVAVGSDIHGTDIGYSEWRTAKRRYPKEWAAAMEQTEARLKELL